MAGLEHVSAYIKAVQSQYSSESAGEHAYRPALYQLMSSFHDVEAINDPKRSAHGAPDFVFQRKSNRDLVLGYAEAKDINTSLDKVEQSDQMKRYAGYQALFLTDYLEFRFYSDGEHYRTIRIGRIADGKIIPDPAQYVRLADELQEFLDQPPQQITSGKRLAQLMGAKARRIRDDVRQYLHEGPPENEEIVKIFSLMRELLVHDLDHRGFSDMYAQTLVYGLFVARYNDDTPESFSRNEARIMVPKTNPFLLHFFDHIVGPNFDERLARAVDELCEVFRVSDVKTLAHRHIHGSNGNAHHDPIIHFYEDFLEAYDADLRRAMGAYYTPLPIVDYIVRQVDRILKEEFGVKKGLADSSKIKYKVDDGQLRKYRDRRTGRTKTVVGQEIDVHRIQVLDPAVGTATFLNEIIQHVYRGFKGGQEGRWPAYVNNDLIPRLNGFEFMMAPYTIAHLKLGMTLEETGVQKLSNRLRVFLTNTLEEGIRHQPDLFSFGLADAVTEESRQAGIIKSDHPIMVVVGNPPYAAQSSNDTEYANRLVAKYKYEPGGQIKLQERKHWLHDDYLKFIAFAEDIIKKNGEGIVAMITAHGYLHNKTSRGVRWRLTETFDKIFALDLHGNVKRKEVAPDGSKDENVFDIQQGVSIILAIKHKDTESKAAEVFSADLYGSREAKFERLAANDIEWHRVALDRVSYRFGQTSTEGKEVYNQGVRLDELFIVSNTSLVTARDKVVVDIDRDTLLERMERFADPTLTDDEVRAWLFSTRSGRKYPPGDTRGWKLPDARALVRDEDIDSYIQPLAYRPFDSRYVYYSKSMVDWPRYDVMKHMTRGPNIGLVFRRQMPEEKGASYFFVSDRIISDGYIKSDNKGSEMLGPLRLYPDEYDKSVSNLRQDRVKILTRNLGREVGDEEIFDYVYGVVHSPTYRLKFHEFLKYDFPRIPVASNDQEFDHFRVLGHRLRKLHLMDDGTSEDHITTYPVSGSDVVEKCWRTGEQVWINKHQYFGNVPDYAWEFVVGAYKPAQKWLQQRKGVQLSSADIDHYQRIIRVLVETHSIVHAIDNISTRWMDDENTA